MTKETEAEARRLEANLAEKRAKVVKQMDTYVEQAKARETLQPSLKPPYLVSKQPKTT